MQMHLCGKIGLQSYSYDISNLQALASSQPVCQSFHKYCEDEEDPGPRKGAETVGHANINRLTEVWLAFLNPGGSCVK